MEGKVENSKSTIIEDDDGDWVAPNLDEGLSPCSLLGTSNLHQTLKAVKFPIFWNVQQLVMTMIPLGQSWLDRERSLKGRRNVSTPVGENTDPESSEDIPDMEDFDEDNLVEEDDPVRRCVLVFN